ncbi:MAG TPA: class I SAM-dependent methyltransferase [Candidatus Enterocloster excrementigallinarum]|uniref:Class I SAM-dependent methyltransferase n=1 Tax=Candidatus Enterocloster excrementigallinarum TaxID=2838558 RepID=A0A9D2PUR4_9FIRM|nr:class I SAM-dependent methyltransferase [Candidatus Enterocloster excrementigallinarum]
MEDKRRYDLDETIKYYEEYAQEFIEATIHADVSELYRQFEEHLTPGSRILDLGCGSGRDSKYFTEKGYDVVAIDPSGAMCDQTKQLAHIPVYQMKAEELRFFNEFDAVWACASLLHVPYKEQVNVLRKVMHALRAGGILYASWKYGDKSRTEKYRSFTDLNEKTFRDILSKIPTIDEARLWVTQDVRKDKHSQTWLNAIIRKAV